MNIGDYYRTKYGINKLTEDKYVLNEIIKSSPNIIDLIEVGDYVNGHRVIKIDNKSKDIFDKYLLVEEVDYDDCNISYANSDIKSIVTKEQFESMEYKVGE